MAELESRVSYCITLTNLLSEIKSVYSVLTSEMTYILCRVKTRDQLAKAR